MEVHFGEQVVELPLSYATRTTCRRAGAEVVLGVRPEDVLITDAGVEPNTIKTRVERSEALGSEILVHLSHAEVAGRRRSPPPNDCDKISRGAPRSWRRWDRER